MSLTMRLADVLSLEGFDIGLMDYPIFDESYRLGLNHKILDHFYLREIGQEDVDVFKFFLNRKMREIMPPYNELYKTIRYEFDPLATIDLTTVHDDISQHVGSDNATTNSTNDNTSKSRSVNSQFPQVALSGNEDYATSAADVNSEGTGESKGNSQTNSTADNSSHGSVRVFGRQGSANQMITEFRNNILNVDMNVLGDLEPCFMQTFTLGAANHSFVPPGIIPGLSYRFFAGF